MAVGISASPPTRFKVRISIDPCMTYLNKFFTVVICYVQLSITCAHIKENEWNESSINPYHHHPIFFLHPFNINKNKQTFHLKHVPTDTAQIANAQGRMEGHSSQIFR